MAENSGTNKNSDPRKWHPILSAIVGAIVGGGGSLGIFFSTPIGQELARPNPYTSIEAQAAHRGFDNRITKLESHVDNHPDGELRAAIALVVADVAAGKAERKLIIQNQNRILDRLDKVR